jgi:hypothetical protein
MKIFVSMSLDIVLICIEYWMQISISNETFCMNSGFFFKNWESNLAAVVDNLFWVTAHWMNPCHIDTYYLMIERLASGENRTHVLTKWVIQNSNLLTNYSVTETLLLHSQILLYIRYPRFYSAQTQQFVAHLSFFYGT